MAGTIQMEVFDYNGEGKWSAAAILDRYARSAAAANIVPREMSLRESSQGERRWVWPVMEQIIQGIEAGDPACVRIGIEFIEQDGRFPFGRILKASTARALRRTRLTDDQKVRIRRRVFDMLRVGNVPHEFREYAKLVRTMGFAAEDVPDVSFANERPRRFLAYFRERPWRGEEASR